MLRASTFTWKPKRVALASATAVLALGVLSSAASAATINVTTTADKFGGGGGCSLREAIKAANTNANFGGCSGSAYGNDTVDVPDGTYMLSIPGTSELNDATGDLNVVSGGGSLTKDV